MHHQYALAQIADMHDRHLSGQTAAREGGQAVYALAACRKAAFLFSMISLNVPRQNAKAGLGGAGMVSD